ncbi:CYTH domain-containing protein [Actinokineospora guangxiensis]|uniref:CYTH domain-containing protein n=1 Tax=Actinokineospora guangxiensis TaxID=1490288 RepID=A0ABW0EL31_9PSEU
MSKEQSDDREREFKFATDRDLEDVLDVCRREVRQGWHLVQFQPRTVQDIYFDTPDLALARTGSCLRFRKRRVNKGWTANYKDGEVESEKDFVDRREVITQVSVEEAQRFATGVVPGLAWSLAVEALGGGADLRLVPIVQIETSRRGWSVRAGRLDDRQNNYVGLVWDRGLASACDTDGALFLLANGGADWTARRQAEFAIDNYELESDGRSVDDEAGSVEAVRRLAAVLTDELGVEVLRRSKYQAALDGLRIGAGR